MQFVLTAAGGAILGPAGAFAGSLIGGALDRSFFGPPDTRTDAPPLESLTVTVSSDGQPIGDGIGTHPRVGRLLWSDEKKENRVSETSSAGKDFGGPEHTTTTVNPTVTCAYSFGWGPGLPMWIKANKRMLADFRPGSSFVFEPGVQINVYDGTQTLPSYLAESIFPAAPAYRGQIIVEFIDLPIRQFGDDPPQVLESMIVMAGSTAPATTELQVDPANCDDLGSQYFDQETGYLWMVWDDGNNVPRTYIQGVLDVKTRTWVYQNRVNYNSDGDFPGGIEKLYRINADGTAEALMIMNTDDLIYVFDPDSVVLLSIEPHPEGGSIFTAANQKGLLSFNNTAGGGATNPALWSHYTNTEYSQDLNSELLGSGYDFVSTGGIIELNETFIFFLKKTSDNTLATAEWFPVEAVNGGSLGPINDQAIFDGGVDWTVTAETVYAPFTNTWFCPGTVTYIAGIEPVIFEVAADGTLIETIRVLSLGAPGMGSALSGLPLIQYIPEINSIVWKSGTTYCKYSLSTRLVTNQNIGVSNNWTYYDQATDTVVGGVLSGLPGCGVNLTRLNTTDSVQIPIADAVRQVCERVGVPAANINTTGLAGLMWGAPYLIGSAARTTIEGLLSKANGFGVLTSNQLRFLNFGGATARSFDIAELGARKAGTRRTSALTEELPQSLDIPAVMDLDYININAEGEKTIVRSRYFFSNRSRTAKQQTRVVLDSAEAAEFVNRLHQGMVNRTAYDGVQLLPKHIDLDPGDIIEVTEAGADTRRLIITGQTLSPDLGFRLQGISEDAEDSVTDGVGAFEDVFSSVSSAVNPQVLVFDTSLLRDVDNKTHLGPYLAVYRSGTTVSTASIYGSVSGETYDPLTVMNGGAAVAIAETAMLSTGSIDEWDEQTLRVEFVSGSAPASLTDADVLAGGNACIIGRTGRWEIIQPATWTLVSGNTYDCTHILRGRRGTNPFVASHETADFLVVLNPDTIRRLTLSASLIDSIYNVKAVAPGSTLTEATAKSVVLTGQPMKPYTVVDVAMVDASGTHTWTWLARTRAGGVYGGTNGLIDGYVGSQADGTTFEIEILNLAQTIVYATRTVTAETLVYTPAMRTDDGLGSGQDYILKIYHMNGTIRGHQVLGNSLGGSYSEIALNLGPVIGYVMDETSGTTADNIQGTASRDATYTGTYTLAEPTIISGGALSVGFTDGYLDVPDAVRSALFQVPGVTLSCAVDIDSLTGTTEQSLFAFFTGTLSTIGLLIDPSTDEIEAYARTNTVYANTIIRAPITGGLHHVAMTVDPPNDRFILYVDGVALTTLDPAGFTWTTDFRGLDGGAPSSGRRHQIYGSYNSSQIFVGNGQGPYIYAKVLTGEQIAAMAAFVLTA